ncbi:hypothetical protein DIPPA_23228 [Diplonema papillatum]|nr:hypothetical protein DIPPA_23228 [Diplonema papillatum]KAJ9452967.1 hypothetical protein DIPPA_23228 [Diplonema papillatum]KAJ9452968.1 hypothetical protein DIPPA_23228 [Diplonema papillatum]
MPGPSRKIAVVLDDSTTESSETSESDSTETGSGFDSSSFSSGSGDAYRPLSSLKRPGNRPPRGRSTEDARHAFHREPAGGQQPKAKAGASPPVHRWKPDGDPAVHLGSISFFSGTETVTLADATPHNPGGRCEPHETAANLCHAAPNKRWCDAAFAPVIFEFPQPVSVTAYMFTTAYCDPSKDPICWVLSGANEPDTSSSDQNSGSDENAPAAASSKTLRSRRASSPLGHAGRASPTSILKSPTAQASPASAWPEDVFSLDRSSSCKAKNASKRAALSQSVRSSSQRDVLSPNNNTMLSAFKEDDDDDDESDDWLEDETTLPTFRSTADKEKMLGASGSCHSGTPAAGKPTFAEPKKAKKPAARAKGKKALDASSRRLFSFDWEILHKQSTLASVPLHRGTDTQIFQAVPAAVLGGGQARHFKSYRYIRWEVVKVRGTKAEWIAAVRENAAKRRSEPAKPRYTSPTLPPAALPKSFSSETGGSPELASTVPAETSAARRRAGYLTRAEEEQIREQEELAACTFSPATNEKGHLKRATPEVRKMHIEEWHEKGSTRIRNVLHPEKKKGARRTKTRPESLQRSEELYQKALEQRERHEARVAARERELQIAAAPAVKKRATDERFDELYRKAVEQRERLRARKKAVLREEALRRGDHRPAPESGTWDRLHHWKPKNPLPPKRNSSSEELEECTFKPEVHELPKRYRSPQREPIATCNGAGGRAVSASGQLRTVGQLGSTVPSPQRARPAEGRVRPQSVLFSRPHRSRSQSLTPPHNPRSEPQSAVADDAGATTELICEALSALDNRLDYIEERLHLTPPSPAPVSPALPSSLLQSTESIDIENNEESDLS